ncbi:MAG: hypothetical protein O2890_11380, partial [Cyanobacteria bacterium]|nr:hypothetical protein [Cyanobacteriota bacterium]
MSDLIFDEYSLALDNLAVTLESSYERMKCISLSCETYDYSKVLVNRLRAFYCAQDRIKKILGKHQIQNGADFFVEVVLFVLKVFIETEKLNIKVASEQKLQKKRGSIKPDISIWRNDTLLAIVECKTQLGWMRNHWPIHFREREERLKEIYPESELFVLVMTSCNWSGFGRQADNPEVNQKFFCLLKETWPTFIPHEAELPAMESPIENLLMQVRRIALR